MTEKECVKAPMLRQVPFVQDKTTLLCPAAEADSIGEAIDSTTELKSN